MSESMTTTQRITYEMAYDFYDGLGGIVGKHVSFPCGDAAYIQFETGRGHCYVMFIGRRGGCFNYKKTRSGGYKRRYINYWQAEMIY